MAIQDLFQQPLKIINIGSPSFVADYDLQGVDHIHLDWKPPANGDLALIRALSELEPYRDQIDAANREAVTRVKQSEARLVGIKLAKEVVPNLKDRMILHAGPWIRYEDMAGPVKGAIAGAILYEGWAQTLEEAEVLAASNTITYEPCHEHAAVGPMAGVMSPSMPVHVIYNETYGNYAYCTVNEGLGKVLRFGANDESVLMRLRWIQEVFMPVMDEAIQLSGGIDIKNLVAQAVQMGDECHNRNKASSALFLREIVGSIMSTHASREQQLAVVEFIRKNEHYFLNLSMPFAKVSMDAAREIPFSTLVTSMARNGVEFGIQISATGSKWYTHQANYVQGLLFSGYRAEDAARDLGDSTITETRGIGGFAMGSAPAIVQFVGGRVADALNYSIQMNEICLDQNENFTIPTLDFRPTAFGIDVLKVIETNVLPIINTGIAHKEAGVGQVGAGLVHPPYECFAKALLAFVEQVRKDVQP